MGKLFFLYSSTDFLLSQYNNHLANIRTYKKIIKHQQEPGKKKVLAPIIYCTISTIDKYFSKQKKNPTNIYILHKPKSQYEKKNLKILCVTFGNQKQKFWKTIQEQFVINFLTVLEFYAFDIFMRKELRIYQDKLFFQFGNYFLFFFCFVLISNKFKWYFVKCQNAK